MILLFITIERKVVFARHSVPMSENLYEFQCPCNYLTTNVGQLRGYLEQSHLLSSQWAIPKFKENTLEQNQIH